MKKGRLFGFLTKVNKSNLGFFTKGLQILAVQWEGIEKKMMKMYILED